jgi:hypothetical protein
MAILVGRVAKIRLGLCPVRDPHFGRAMTVSPIASPERVSVGADSFCRITYSRCESATRTERLPLWDLVNQLCLKNLSICRDFNAMLTCNVVRIDLVQLLC